MIQKHNFSNAALLNGLTMRKETHQTADDKWRHELGQAEAEVAKLAEILMERKTLVTSGQTQYPGTSTPRELENKLKSKSIEKRQAEAKIDELRVATRKNELSKYHQLVDMSGMKIEFSDEHAVLTYKAKDHKLSASTLTKFKPSSLF